MYGYVIVSFLSEVGEVKKICFFLLYGYVFLSLRFFYVVKKVIILQERYLRMYEFGIFKDVLVMQFRRYKLFLILFNWIYIVVFCLLYILFFMYIDIFL